MDGGRLIGNIGIGEFMVAILLLENGGEKSLGRNCLLDIILVLMARHLYMILKLEVVVIRVESLEVCLGIRRIILRELNMVTCRLPFEGRILILLLALVTGVVLTTSTSLRSIIIHGNLLRSVVGQALLR